MISDERFSPALAAWPSLMTAARPANVLRPGARAIHRRDSQVPARLDSCRDLRGIRAPPVVAHSKEAEPPGGRHWEHDARRHNHKVETLASQVAPLQALCEGSWRIRDQ